jgi:hypothetical protein
LNLLNEEDEIAFLLQYEQPKEVIAKVMVGQLFQIVEKEKAEKAGKDKEREKEKDKKGEKDKN